MAEAKACEAEAPAKVTKSGRIIDLLATTDLTREQIAEQIGCLPAYVRVVEQRLAADSGEAPEERWYRRNRQARLGQMRAYNKTRYRRKRAESRV